MYTRLHQDDCTAYENGITSSRARKSSILKLLLPSSRSLVLAATVVAVMTDTQAFADPPTSAADNPYRNYWGPMEPQGKPHAGPQVRAGKYQLSWATVPRDASVPEKWPWVKGPQIAFQGARRYFIHFQADGRIQVHDEQNLPLQEQQAIKVAGWATVWFQNGTDDGRIAVRCLPVSDQPHDGMAESSDPDYWGPMEPQVPAHAGPEQSPGRFRIEWAIVPPESRPSRQWPWQNGPELLLEGGKRYFVHFAEDGRIEVHTESKLPPAEVMVRPVSGRAILWLQNSTLTKRIAVRFRPINSAAGSTVAEPGERKFTREFPKSNRSVVIVVRGTQVTGDYDTGTTELKPQPGDSSLQTAMAKHLGSLHTRVRFEGTYVPATGRVTGVAFAQPMVGDQPDKRTGPNRGTFEGSLVDGVLQMTFQVKLTFYKETDVHRLKLTEIRPEAVVPVKITPSTVNKE